MNITFEILIIVFLILLNGLFAMYEMAMISSKKARLEQRSQDNNAGSKLALKMLETPNRFLSTVQVGITLVGILAGAFGGARLAEPLAAVFNRLGWFGNSAQGIALALVVIVITFFSLLLGELIPKRIALNNPEGIASHFSGFMNILSKLTQPVVSLLSGATDLGIRLLRIKPQSEPTYTEEEIKILIEEGAEHGIFQEAEQDMVTGVFRLGARRVDALMIPRTEMVWLDIEDDRAQLIKEIIESEFSRLPVAEGDLDHVIGILNTKDLVGIDLHDPDFQLENLVRTPLFVPDQMPALTMFDRFRETGIHQALVIDEYGGVVGMVTLYDVLESIVGDIPLDEHDRDQDAVQRSDGSWLIDGMLPLDELKDLLDVDEFPEEERAGYQTLSGFIMNQLGSIPKVGQKFVWDRYEFEVVDMDGRRVDRVMVSNSQTETGSG